MPKTIREMGYSVGSMIHLRFPNNSNGTIYSYRVIDVGSHFIRVVCQKCGKVQSFHLDDNTIKLYEGTCCPRSCGEDLYQTHNFKSFLKHLRSGEEIFGRYRVLAVFFDSIFVECTICRLSATMYKSDAILRYCSDNTFPKRFTPSDGLCCPARKKLALKLALQENNETEAPAQEEKVAEIRSGRRLLYSYKGEKRDIHELSTLHGIPVVTIRTNIRSGMTAEEAVMIGGITGEELIKLANEHHVDPSALRRLVKKGLEPDIAVKHLESPVSRQSSRRV